MFATAQLQKVTEDPVGYIDDQLSALSTDQQYEFFNLSHADPNVSQDLIPVSIIQTNGIAAGPNRVGMFPRTARLNHGCSSAFNVVYSYKEKENILGIFLFPVDPRTLEDYLKHDM